MPDFDPGRGTRPMRRAMPLGSESNRRRYGPGGLPSEGADPAPKPWPWAPGAAFIVCLCFLGLQLYPATHFRHPADRHRNWQPIRTADEIPNPKELTLEEVRRQWDPNFPENDQGDESPPTLFNSGEIIEQLENAKSGNSDNDHLRKRRSEQRIHIFLSSDEKDLRPLAVVINSTLKNARHPERIAFHLIIAQSGNNIEYYKLRTFFPSASIEVFRADFDFKGLSNLIGFRTDSHTRGELTSPYNFIPYYLPELYKNVELMIYLDTDVVVKGDIEELYSKNLNGHPVAAVEDCSQRFKSYFDFEQLKAIQESRDTNQSLRTEPFDEDTCVFNRGVLLINSTRWAEQNVTREIEMWMEEYLGAELGKPLYSYGLSQPPFLLALYKNYEKLEHAWNNRGLGRDKFSKLEQDYYETRYKFKPSQKPYLSPESDYAKILHFNGKYKPWKRSRTQLPTEEVVSLCGEEGKDCHKLWWEYLSPEASDAFQHSPESG